MVGIERKEETMIFHSSFEYIYLWLPLLGFVVGFFGSFTGGGGGFVFIPLLTLLFGVEAHVAIGSSLAATLPIAWPAPTDITKETWTYVGIGVCGGWHLEP